MTPYAFGMYAAYYHLTEREHPEEERDKMDSCGHICFEWISTIILTFFVFFGAKLAVIVVIFGVDPTFHYIYYNTSRQIFGGLLSYLLTMMLAPEPE